MVRRGNTYIVAKYSTREISLAINFSRNHCDKILAKVEFLGMVYVAQVENSITKN